MRFDFTIYADTPTELGDALDAARNWLPENLFDDGRPFSILVTPDDRTPRTTVAPAPAAEARPARRPKPAPKAAEPEPEPEDTETDYYSRRDADGSTMFGPGEDIEISPADAKLKALDLLRDAYGRTGGPALVKALQKKHGVSKFSDVPDSEGLDLLAQANALIAKLPA
jgi:hypothetical protein